MQDKLVGYLLDALELEEVAQVEQLLASNVDAQRQLDVLRLGLTPLEADRQHVEVPRGLGIRTLRRIRALVRRA